MISTKIAASLMVALMMFSGVAVMVDAGDNDATVWTPNGSGDLYTYTLHYDSSEMGNAAAQELQLSVAGTTPISHTAGTTTLSTVANEGSWGFDTTTGIGPFNSCYAAFDRTDGNKFVAILNPYDLTETIDGVDISASISNYNIMWVIPTVYWSVGQNGDLTLTNDSTSGGVAYAHTINGIVYNYLAIGVYEGSVVDNLLTSTTGNTVTVKKSSDWSSSYVNYTMDDSLGSTDRPALSAFIRYYQTMLYRYCSLCVMEGWDSQSIVGNGVTGTYSAIGTGLTDTLGPYAGNPGPVSSDGTNADLYAVNSVKCFIENAWGNANDFINGLTVNSTQFTIYPNPSNSDSPVTVNIVVPSGFATGISTDVSTWGIPTDANNGAYNIGTTDASTAYSSTYNRSFGGGTGPVANWANAGINSFNLNVSNTGTCAQRLMFAFDTLIPVVTASFAVNDDNYGSVTDASIADIEPGTTATISGNTITISETTVTATPASADAQYTYAFSKWQVSGSDVTGTYTLDADTTFTAVFTATTNQYTVTIAPNDPSYGSVSPTSLTVDYGTAITVDGTNLSIGEQAITATASDATAQYTYAFSSWTVPDAAETVIGAITITGTFTATVNTYTVTIESADVSLGTVDVSEVQDVPYGTAITVSGDTITIGETTVTATPSDGLVTKWSVSDGAIVTGDLTVTASFVQPANVENTLIQLIPFLLIMVLVVTAAAGVFSAGGDPENLIRLVIGLAVAVLIIAVFVLPTVGGM